MKKLLTRFYRSPYTRSFVKMVVCIFLATLIVQFQYVFLAKQLLDVLIWSNSLALALAFYYFITIQQRLRKTEEIKNFYIQVNPESGDKIIEALEKAYGERKSE
ncbi:putative membrane protein [Bacillus phage SP-15]|uniref:Putative membrane protein n=1 Tax=Bacillus phage SP-15 TaxID=1792032 RepID=A0A127AWG0_9CAUD|nr:hypothetical protein SP15_198 [Bacillus phage SP-15]AMM44998.1 putative membrane protein [Bacillus phage SP-15]